MTELMIVEEVAHYLRVTKKTVYRLLKGGKIPATKIGQQWRFDRVSLDQWLERSSPRAKAEILVIDDKDEIRALFRKTLEKCGYKVTTAKDSPEGLELVKQREFDLVFLDFRMPGMDGAELLHQIRVIKHDLPVTITTGYPDSALMARALAQGAFGVMNKPFSESDIVGAVNNFLQITR